MKISFVNGLRKGETINLQPPGVCIGRESDNDIQLLVAGISRYHAKISFDGIRWTIQDLGSTNGTKVNGSLITVPTALLAGDELILGDQTLLFGDLPIDPHKLETIKNMGNTTAQEPSRQQPNQTPIPSVAPQTQKPPAEIPIELKHPEPQNKPKEEKTPPPPLKPELKLTSSTPKIPPVNIFGKKKEEEKKKEKQEQQDAKPLRKRLMFPLLVVSLALIAVSFFIKQNFMTPPEKPAEGLVKKTPPEFIVHYERVKTDPDNVYRFEFLIENGRAEFILDDLKYGRHFEKKFDSVKPNLLKTLEDSIRDTEFMKLKQEPTGALGSDKTDEQRSLTVGIDNKLNKISVRNSFPQSSFETIERAIERFASDNGIPTASMNVDEMKKNAFNTFRKAEDLFANYQAKPENLREAISRYKLAMEYLEQFSPKPTEWDISRKRLAEAEDIYARIMKDFTFNIQRYNKLKQFDKGSEECQKAMDTVEPGSDAYFKLKQYKLAFDKQRRK